MAITYAAGSGTVVTTYAMNETLGDQTQQSGNNTVVVSDTISNAGNGQIGSGANGIGNSYVGRLLAINLGASQQVRRCISESAGTGTTYILTVHEDWDTNPVASTDTIHVCYELADVEDGGAGGGIALGAKTGLWELSNVLTIGDGTNPAGLQILGGSALEADDRGASIGFYILNAGDLYTGYEASGKPVNGGIVTGYNNTTGEPWIQFASGSRAFLFDSLLWAQLVGQQLENANGSSSTYWGTKIISGTDEAIMFDATLIEASISGRGLSSEIVRVDAGTSTKGLVLSNVQTLNTASGDTSTETITLEGVSFSGVPDYINVNSNKTWNMIDPVWGVVDYTDLVWTTTTANYVNDRSSVKVTVQEADGTKLSNALVNVYEHTQLQDLVLELLTDTDGYTEDSYIYKAHATGSTTTTYGGHAVQCGKWLYKPFVASQVSADAFAGVIVLSPDTNINETTQATAISDGSGVVWNEDTNPSSVIAFTGGSGGTVGLAVGQTITASPSGANGIVTAILSGDGAAGEIHLKTRNTTAFASGDTLSNGADGWTATYTASSQQDFSVWIEGNSKSVQTIYDYLAALQTQTTLSATGELIWEWCRHTQTQPLYTNGSTFWTDTSSGRGIIIVNQGGGTISYFNDDAGTPWYPPTSVTVEFKATDNTGSPIDSVRVTAYRVSDDFEIINTITNASGIASTSYTGTTPADFYYRFRKSSAGATKYFNLSGLDTIVAGSGASVKRIMEIDTTADPSI